MAGLRLRRAWVSISGTDVSSQNSQGVISNPRQSQVVHAADRNRALEMARSVEVPADRNLLHVIPRSYTLDGQKNIKNPVGMYGFRLNVDTHIVTATAALVQSLTGCVNGLGIGVRGLVLKSLASAESVLATAAAASDMVPSPPYTAMISAPCSTSPFACWNASPPPRVTSTVQRTPAV